MIQTCLRKYNDHRNEKAVIKIYVATILPGHVKMAAFILEFQTVCLKLSSCILVLCFNVLLLNKYLQSFSLCVY